MDTTVLLVPGYTNSGPQHWQTLWQKAHPYYERVEQHDWNHPVPEVWMSGIQASVSKIKGPVVLVGHSCGSVSIAQWAAKHDTSQIKAALLVAPGDVDAHDALPEITFLRPMPTVKLPFPSILIASDNDPHLKLERAHYFAETWGSKLIVIEGAGHIHTAAGYGPWPYGEELLQELLRDGDSAVGTNLST